MAKYVISEKAKNGFLSAIEIAISNEPSGV